jgi:uncharacterized protein (DUF433 family)
MAALDWSQCPTVESVPEKVSGAWVFRGTRMPVAAVFENLEDGLTIDELVELYDGLTREQVQAVLEFAARSLELPALAGCGENGRFAGIGEPVLHGQPNTTDPQLARKYRCEDV